MTTNAQLARMLREIGMYLEMDAVPFKPRAYEKAAAAIEAMEEDLRLVFRRGGIVALEAIPGVGKNIAEKIHEYLQTGKIAVLSKYQKHMPVQLTELTNIEAVGPMTVKTLFDRLHITTVKQLKAAATKHALRDLPGFGERKEAQILQGVAFLEHSGTRLLLGDVLPTVRTLRERIASLTSVGQVTVGGSIRRWQETVGDIDIVLTATKPEKVMRSLARFPEVERTLARGSTKMSVRLSIGINLDLRIVPQKSFGAAEQYFTGDKAHNIQLRERAQKKGWTLNEYGLFRKNLFLAGRTEADIYQKLGLAWIPPELRTDHGEIAAAERNALPKLIPYGALQGDLQTQTDWTDGADSIGDMAAAAKRSGLAYIAITDHTRSLAMTGGADEKKLLRQVRAIQKLNKTLRGFRILTGAEVNIQRDGTLDIADHALKQLDVVGIAIHSHFHLSRSEMTKRILRAMHHPSADILFHPTGRVINQRAAYEVDMEAVFREAKKTKTVFEIDAFPSRLDLHDEYVRMGLKHGAAFVIDSDAHSVQHFAYLDYGIGQARRGWAKSADILNTKSASALLAELRRRRRFRTHNT